MNTPRTALEELIALVRRCPELNLFNYTSEDVEALNDWAVEVYAALDDHGKALSEALGGWLPIETAPKDGTEVLIWLRDPYSRPALASWFEPWSMWVEFEGEDDDSPGGIGSLVPTHWQPITPPTSAKESEVET